MVRIQGIARNVEMRQESQGENFHETVLTFRVEILDEKGDVIEYKSVEFRASSISGDIRDGDEVKVEGQIKDGFLFANSVTNLNTSAKVQKKSNSKIFTIFIIAVFVIIIVIAVTIFSTAFSLLNDDNIFEIVKLEQEKLFEEHQSLMVEKRDDFIPKAEKTYTGNNFFLKLPK